MTYKLGNDVIKLNSDFMTPGGRDRLAYELRVVPNDRGSSKLFME